MEMEHINENTILIKVANQDLIDRGVSLVDLFTNPTQVEPFFHGLLEELDLLEYFTETEALTFQVMPNPEGLEIYVSESLHLKPSTDTESNDESEEIIKQIKEVVDTNAVNVLDLVGNGFFNNQEEAEDEEEFTLADEEILPKDISKTIIFNEFEDFISLARELKKEDLDSALYEHNGRYFLSFRIDKHNLRKAAILAIILEYGEESTINKLVLQEYGHVVMPEDALATARKFFK